MDFNDFCENCMRVCLEKLPDNYELRLNDITKNNGCVLTGLIAGERGRNIHPTVYLNEFYNAYCRGMDMEAIGQEIADCIMYNSPEDDFDIGFINDYDTVGKRIIFRVINYERNIDFLKDVPYKRVMDLAVVFYMFIEIDDMGEGSILVKNEYLDDWGVDVDRLYEDAMINTPAFFPTETLNIKDMLREILRERARKEGKDVEWTEGVLNDDYDVPMYVITNCARNYGANVILFSGVFDELSSKLDSDLYILPSSVHELIAIPAKDDEKPVYLSDMVKTVNETEVEPDQVLSDNVYIFRRFGKAVEAVAL